MMSFTEHKKGSEAEFKRNRELIFKVTAPQLAVWVVGGRTELPSEFERAAAEARQQIAQS